MNQRRVFLGACTSLSLSPSWAQFRVEVSGVGLTQMPLALTTFRGEENSPQKISAIVQADLERSGLFKAVDSAGQMLDETTRLNMVQWRQKKADAVLTGSVQRLADGRFDVRFRLWDVVKGQDLGGKSFAVSVAELRLVAHRVADFVHEKLLGERGVFSTRIAYITKQANRYQLWVADADGEGAQSALTSPEPLISPAWSPSGAQLAYVSFESRKAVVYVHEITTGKRRAVANFKGSNTAPAWSPDGQSLAMTLSRDGGSQLFLMQANGAGEPRRLMTSNAIDTEPVFSPDGKQLYFVSDRGGSPQIYRLPLSGGAAAGAAERVTFNGSYNVSPAISPDGKHLAYIARTGAAFRLHVMNLASGDSTAITDTDADESPSFAPHGRLLIYATQVQGKEALMTSTLDGKIKAKLGAVSGDIREPDWGPHQ